MSASCTFGPIPPITACHAMDPNKTDEKQLIGSWFKSIQHENVFPESAAMFRISKLQTLTLNHPSYEIPDALSKFVAPTSTKIDANQLVLMVGSSIYQLGIEGKIPKAEKLLSKMMDELFELEMSYKRALHQPKDREKTKEEPTQDILDFGNAIAQLTGASTASIHSFQSDLCFFKRITCQDDVEKIEALELAIIGVLEGIYHAKKTLQYDLHSELLALEKQLTASPVDLREFILCHIDAIIADSNEENCEETKACMQVDIDVLLVHWKYAAAKHVYSCA